MAVFHGINNIEVVNNGDFLEELMIDPKDFQRRSTGDFRYISPFIKTKNFTNDDGNPDQISGLTGDVFCLWGKEIADNTDCVIFFKSNKIDDNLKNLIYPIPDFGTNYYDSIENKSAFYVAAVEDNPETWSQHEIEVNTQHCMNLLYTQMDQINHPLVGASIHQTILLGKSLRSNQYTLIAFISKVSPMTRSSDMWINL